MSLTRFFSKKGKQDIDAIKSWDGWETISTETLGTLYGNVNQSIKLASLRWMGNATSPSGNLITISIANKYKPSITEMMAPLRNGDNIKVKNAGSVEIQLQNMNWSAGIITYPTV